MDRKTISEEEQNYLQLTTTTKTPSTPENGSTIPLNWPYLSKYRKKRYTDKIK